MKNIVLSFNKFLAVAACALTLGSCNRAEYAMLPKGSSYHGVTRAATPVPPAATAAKSSAVETVAPAESAPEAAVANATPVAQSKAATAQVASPVAESAGLATASSVAMPKHRLNIVQRVAVKAMAKKLDKLVQKAGTARQHYNTASISRGGGISGNLRIGIILLLVGLLVGLLNGLIGTIIAIVGLIFIILWLLDQL